MKFSLLNFSNLTIFIILLTYWPTIASYKTWFSKQNVNYLVEKPERYINNRTEDGKSSSGNVLLKALQETLDYSTSENEDWSKLLKRVGILLLTEKKDLALRKNLLNADLARSLFKVSPQFLKDSITTNLRGSIWPMVKERLIKIASTIYSHNTTERMGKENGRELFDPFVFGFNGLLNLFYAAAFASFVTPNMGLDNLFNPDYDFDYDSLNEEEASDDPTEATITTTELTQPILPDGNSSQLAQLPSRVTPFYDDISAEDTEGSSSYLHYDGQYLSNRPYQNLFHISQPQSMYHHFKMFRPNERK